MNKEFDQEVSADQVEDTNGLEEIQKAMDKINELNNNSEELPFEEPEASEEAHSTGEEKESEESLETEEVLEEQNDTQDVEAIKEDDSTKPKTSKQKEKKFWKERREKYKALAERDRIASELEELKTQRDKALEVGNYHYGQNAYSDLEKAKILKKRAIEEGEIDAYLDADIALTKATNAVDEIEKWNFHNQPIKEDPKQSIRQSDTAHLQQEMAQDWLESHEEINPSSVNYQPQLAKKVGAFINQLDQNITDNGRSEYYFSEPYFEAIEDHLEKLKNTSQKTNTPPPSVNNVSGVKKSYQSQPGTNKPKQRILLTADEKRMASNAGISEAEWLKYKIEDLNKQKKRA